MPAVRAVPARRQRQPFCVVVRFRRLQNRAYLWIHGIPFLRPVQRRPAGAICANHQNRFPTAFVVAHGDAIAQNAGDAFGRMAELLHHIAPC
jgi:hypothetical protein